MIKYYLHGSASLIDENNYLMNLYVSEDGKKCFYNFSYLRDDVEAMSDDYTYFFYRSGLKENSLVTRFNGFLMEKRLNKFIRINNKFK